MASAGMAGVTRNDNLYVGQGTFDETISSDVSFFGHELWHSQQYRHEGFSIGVYFGSSVVTAYDMFSDRAWGVSSSGDLHDNISWEQEATAKGEALTAERKGVGWGKSVSVRVDRGGGRK